MEISIVIPTFQTTLGKSSVRKHWHCECSPLFSGLHARICSRDALFSLTLQCHQHLHQSVTQTLSESLCADLTLLGQKLQRTLIALHESHSLAVIWA